MVWLILGALVVVAALALLGPLGEDEYPYDDDFDRYVGGSE